MSLLIPELERQLRAAARARRSEQEQRLRRWVPGLGQLMLALGVLAVAAIVVPAVLLLGYRGSTTTAPPGGGIPHPVPGEAPGIETCKRPSGGPIRGSGQAPEVLSRAARAAYVMEARGSLDGHTFSLLAKRGENGFRAIEDGRLVLDGKAYGMCPGFANPAEFSLIDTGVHGIAYGYIASPGDYRISLHLGPSIPAPLTRHVLGGTLFIQALPKSACSYHSLTLTAQASSGSRYAHFQHFLSFGRCTPGQLVALTGGQGGWGGTLLQPPPPINGRSPVAEQLSLLGVLRRPPGTLDRMFGQLALKRLLGGIRGVERSYVRVLYESARYGAVVLIPAKSWSGPRGPNGQAGYLLRNPLCIEWVQTSGPGSAGGCQPTSDLTSGHLTGSVGALEYTVVPDGVAKLVFRFRDGTSRTVAVHDNLAMFTQPHLSRPGGARQLPSSVQWLNNHGTPTGPSTR